MIIVERFRAGLLDPAAFVVLDMLVVLVVLAVIDRGSSRVRQRFIVERAHLAHGCHPTAPSSRQAGAAPFRTRYGRAAPRARLVGVVA